MSDSRNNIEFAYLYRDAGNYKVFGSEVFANPDGIDLQSIELQIKSKLIDGEFFEPTKWGIRAASFDEAIDELDHQWNEFEGVKETRNPVSSDRTIEEFLLNLPSA